MVVRQSIPKWRELARESPECCGKVPGSRHLDVRRLDGRRQLLFGPFASERRPQAIASFKDREIGVTELLGGE